MHAIAAGTTRCVGGLSLSDSGWRSARAGGEAAGGQGRRSRFWRASHVCLANMRLWGRCPGRGMAAARGEADMPTAKRDDVHRVKCAPRPHVALLGDARPAASPSLAHDCNDPVIDVHRRMTSVRNPPLHVRPASPLKVQESSTHTHLDHPQWDGCVQNLLGQRHPIDGASHPVRRRDRLHHVRTVLCDEWCRISFDAIPALSGRLRCRC